MLPAQRFMSTAAGWHLKIKNMDEIKTQQTNSMAEIFVNLLSFVLLGIVATSAGILCFQIINKYLPDILSATYQNYRASNYSLSVINYAIASLIIGFPIFLWAIWFWFRSFKNFPEKNESRLSKWLTYIVLFVAGGAIIGDFITVIYNFLQGEYGARFLLKALTIIVIAGLVFGFYFFERKKIQYKKEIFPNVFIFFAVLSGLLIVSAIIFGFIAAGTPFEARIRNFDLRRTNDLQQLSSCVADFAYENERLPKDLSELQNSVRYNYCSFGISDPETKKEYVYKALSKTEFELCGEFSVSNLEAVRTVGEQIGKWSAHDKGLVCEKQFVVFMNKNLSPEKTNAAPPVK